MAAVTADAYRDLELAALAAVAEAVLADLRSAASAIRALVGPVGADLYGANLANADLARADLAGADLTRAILVGADLARADLTRAILFGADLQGTDLTRAGLARANLVGAILVGANLYGANLVRANLYGANLAHADLRHAILIRANLTNADLRDAILIRADLYGANLIGADLTNADLRDASLHDADLAQVLWSSGTLWPEVKASLMRDRSEELRPGVWRVVGSGHADAETEGPLVSIPFPDAERPGCAAPASALAQRGDILLDVVRPVVGQVGALARERHHPGDALRGLRLAEGESRGRCPGQREGVDAVLVVLLRGPPASHEREGDGVLQADVRYPGRLGPGDRGLGQRRQ